MPTLNFLPVWFALSLLRFRLPSPLPMMFILCMVVMFLFIIPSRTLHSFPHDALPISIDGPADLARFQGEGDRGRSSHGSDRKSTRLNSSHVSNSYAVFCLKKKTVGADIAFDADPKFFACLVRFESSSVPTTLPTAYDVYPLYGRYVFVYHPLTDSTLFPSRRSSDLY